MAKFCNQPHKLQPRFPKPKPIPVKPMDPVIIKLFERQYRCYIFARDVVSLTDHRLVGTVRTGDKRLDKALDREVRAIGMTVNQMLDYFRDGVSFHITVPEEAKIIYEAIRDHTDKWRDVLRYGINIGHDAPIQDLIDLELFASAVYQFAKYEYRVENKDDFFSGTMQDFMMIGGGLQAGFSGADGSLPTATTTTQYERDLRSSEYIPDLDVFKAALVRQHMASLNQPT